MHDATGAVAGGLVQSGVPGEGARAGHGRERARHVQAAAGPAAASSCAATRSSASGRRDGAHRGHRGRVPGERKDLRARAARPCAARAARLRRARATRCLPPLARAPSGLPTRADAVLAMHPPRTLARGAARARSASSSRSCCSCSSGFCSTSRRSGDASVAAQLGRSRRALGGVRRRPAVRAHRAPAARRSPRSKATCAATGRCGACSRATWARARRSSRSTPAARRRVRRCRAALLAPTETLAEQHLETVGARWPATSPGRAADGRVSRRPNAARRSARSPPARRRWSIGTHALLQGDVAFRASPSLVVDEQHRFGVAAARRARAARRVGRARAARPAHDGDADPAHAGADLLRRPRRTTVRRAARRAPAGRHAAGRGGATRRAATSSCAGSSRRAGRPTSSAR